MSMRDRVPAGESDSVDLSATLELLASLTQYAEAGAVQPHTLAQAAQHALDEHGDHIEVLVAVAKLHLATGYREAAGRVLGRAARLFPGDSRVEQLLSEAGLDTTRRGPLSTASPGMSQPLSGARPSDEQPPDERPYDTSIRRRSELHDDAPDSARTPVSIRGRAESSGQRARPSAAAAEGTPAGRAVEVIAPGTPRSASGPAPRPTVKMARVAAAPERRWGKGEGREPFDSRPAFDSRPDREPSSHGPQSMRFPGSQRNVPFRDSAPTPASPMPPAIREGSPRTGRAATGNLKLLDPTDERRHLDRYELIGEIASGGMASVFLARIAGVAGFQRFYAIKRLHPHLADEQEFIDMFLDEARLAAGIHHPSVVPILEVGITEAGYYLVMDYIEGDTLSGVTARAAAAGALPRPIALRILIDSLHGLHAAHELTDADGRFVDLVHRDCSPQNILVGIDGTSRITDFGVARASSRLSTTRSATVKGKLAYLSPEQATGRPLDRRSDLFGMGVILWEVLAGRRLFRAESEGATLSRILVEPIPPVTDYAPDIPDLVADVVARSLSRNPADRHPTAADMADALEQTVRAVETPDLFIASPRDVGGYMRELFGGDISARREAVRAWIMACGESGDGPRSQGFRRGAGSPSPPSVRGRQQSAPDLGSASDAEVDSEVPSTKKEASLLREEEAAASKAAPVKPTRAPAPSPPADRTPLAAGVTPPPATPDPTPTAPSASDEAPPPPSEAAPLAPKVQRAVTPARKRPPALLIALTLLLVLAAVAMFALRSFG